MITMAEDNDMVNRPQHYLPVLGGPEIECIDAIHAALGNEQFVGFLRGQVIKYNWRVGKKWEATEDSRKAAWYQARLTALLDKVNCE